MVHRSCAGLLKFVLFALRVQETGSSGELCDHLPADRFAMVDLTVVIRPAVPVIDLFL